MFHQLLKADAVDKIHFGDIDILRLHLPRRVQPPILITLHVDVCVTRLPAEFGRHERLTHDLAGVQGDWRILGFVRSLILSEERGGSREHNQEGSDSGFSQNFHF